MKRGLDLATEFGFHPSFACYEPGFIRLGAALQAVHRGVPQPIYRLMFSNGMSFGFPPKRYALDAYRTLLQSEVPGAPVMIAGLDVDVSELMARSEEHTSELQSLMRISYAVFCLKKKI